MRALQQRRRDLLQLQQLRADTPRGDTLLHASHETIDAGAAEGEVSSEVKRRCAMWTNMLETATITPSEIIRCLRDEYEHEGDATPGATGTNTGPLDQLSAGVEISHRTCPRMALRPDGARQKTPELSLIS